MQTCDIENKLAQQCMQLQLHSAMRITIIMLVPQRKLDPTDPTPVLLIWQHKEMSRHLLVLPNEKPSCWKHACICTPHRFV
jgi:hypothetical protein